MVRARRRRKQPRGLWKTEPTSTLLAAAPQSSRTAPPRPPLIIRPYWSTLFFFPVNQRHTALEDKYSLQAEEVASLTNELAKVSKRLDEVKGEMEEKGESMSDTKPLLRTSDAIKKLSTELKVGGRQAGDKAGRFFLPLVSPGPAACAVFLTRAAPPRSLVRSAPWLWPRPKTGHGHPNRGRPAEAHQGRRQGGRRGNDCEKAQPLRRGGGLWRRRITRLARRLPV